MFKTISPRIFQSKTHSSPSITSLGIKIPSAIRKEKDTETRGTIGEKG